MGDFYCQKCDVHKQFDTLEQALVGFDHAVALMKNRHCPNKVEDFYWEGVPVLAITAQPHASIKSTVPPKMTPRTESSKKPDIIEGVSVVMDSTKPKTKTAKSKKV